MVKGPVDRHGARRVVGHRDHLANLQGIEYRVQFPLLLFGGVRVVRRLVRCSPAQKVEGDDLAITQIRDQAIVDVPTNCATSYKAVRLFATGARSGGFPSARLLRDATPLEASMDRPRVGPR